MLDQTNLNAKSLKEKAANLKGKANKDSSSAERDKEAVELKSYKEHVDKAHWLFATSIFVIGVIILNAILILDAKIEHKMDYLNARIDGLRVEFSPHKSN